VARQTGAEAIHPGYGFLSENPDFAEACDGAGIIFIGPTSSQLRQFGLKHLARGLAAENNVPMLSGSQLLENLAQAKVVAEDIGYPVILKSTAGGGGIGMEVCFDERELVGGFDQVERLTGLTQKLSESLICVTAKKPRTPSFRRACVSPN
jgi:urea carboxylase